jgi:MFS superfamily sulfate permease-like transporter
MNSIDLKKIWQEENLKNQGSPGNKATIEAIIKMRHSKIISELLSDIKLKILLYSLILAIFIGLMLYAIVYLGINFSINSIIPFTLVGLFLLISTTMEITRFLVFTGNADNLPVKESQNYFRKKLNRMKTIDFLSYLILLYLLAILVIRGYIHDIGGFKNLSGSNEFLPLILVFIFILLLTPWFIKYQNNQRYRKTDSNLNDFMEI